MRVLKLGHKDGKYKGNCIEADRSGFRYTLATILHSNHECILSQSLAKAFLDFAQLLSYTTALPPPASAAGPLLVLEGNKPVILLNRHCPGF